MTEDEFRRGPSRDRRPSDLRSRLEQAENQLAKLVGEVRVGSASALPPDERRLCAAEARGAARQADELGALLGEIAPPTTEPGAAA